MIKKDRRLYKKGYRTHIRVIESYKDETGKIKQRTLQSFGYLEDQADPEAFMKMVEAFDQRHSFLKKAHYSEEENIIVDDTIRNYSHAIIDKIYDLFEFESIFSKQKTKAKYKMNSLFKELLIQRMINPRSSKQWIDHKELGSKVQLHQVYRIFDDLNKFNFEFQKHINEKASTLFGTNYRFILQDIDESTYSFQREEDVNYYINQIEGYDPNEILYGMFFKDQSPIWVRAFKGRYLENSKLATVKANIHNTYEDGHYSFVGDGGLYVNENINSLSNNGYGYVFGVDMPEEMFLKPEFDITNDSEFTYITDSLKYKVIETSIPGFDVNGQPVQRKANIILFWRYAFAIFEAKVRNSKIKKLITLMDEQTNEHYEQYQKLLSNSKYDGFSCLVTNEFDLSIDEVVTLWKNFLFFKNDFRLKRSIFKEYPLYVSAETRINSKLLLYYVGQLFVHYLWLKLDRKYEKFEIVTAQREANYFVNKDNETEVLINGVVRPLDHHTKNLIKKDRNYEILNKILEVLEIKYPKN